jgi:hypothetical protein
MSLQKINGDGADAPAALKLVLPIGSTEPCRGGPAAWFRRSLTSEKLLWLG